MIGKFLCYVTLLKKTWDNESEKKEVQWFFDETLFIIEILSLIWIALVIKCSKKLWSHKCFCASIILTDKISKKWKKWWLIIILIDQVLERILCLQQLYALIGPLMYYPHHWIYEQFFKTDKDIIYTFISFTYKK